MKTKVTFTAILLTCFLSGCATSYKPLDFSGGYSEQRINDANWIVTFSGNSNTSYDTVYKYAIQRAKEVCIEHNFLKGIFVLDVNSIIDTKTSKAYLDCTKETKTNTCTYRGSTKTTKYTVEVLISCVSGKLS